jgi:hypothetical protein
MRPGHLAEGVAVAEGRVAYEVNAFTRRLDHERCPQRVPPVTEQALKIYDEPSSTQEFDLCHAPYKRGKAKGGLTWTS